MNARDVVHYGHQTVLKAVDGVQGDDWTRVGVTSHWSTQDVIAHLASFEQLLEDALKSVLGRVPTPMLDAMGRDPRGFNDAEVDRRRGCAAAEVLGEYAATHERVMSLIEELGPDRLRQPGTIPWYGPDYSLDDFIVYTNYAHKREHCAQIRMFHRTS
jgi:hypothetical protein